MLRVFWDGSALVKHYLIEDGSETVTAVFAAVPAERMTLTYLGYTETAAILRRKRNDGFLDGTAFVKARSLLRRDVLDDPAFRLLPTDEADMLNALALVDKHNINASDAIILTAYLRHTHTTDDVCVVVAADRRLLRASAAEGIRTLDPRHVAAADIPAFFASL